MSKINRRQFVAASAAATTAASAVLTTLAVPQVLTASRTKPQARTLGQDEYQFEFVHDWAKLPEKYSWQTTHNVAVDAEGLVYVIHEGRANQPEHPSIFVFDDKGTFVRAFGKQFQGGGHGLEVRTEGTEQFLYVAAYQQIKSIAKLTLTGESVWQRYAPMESGVYADNEDTDRKASWGRDRFLPTNFAFLPFDDEHKGDFFLADGYGSFTIHRYDKDGNWKSHFAGPGDGEGKFNTPHGLWVDDRGDDSVLVVTDRANNRLQVLNLEGEHQRTIDGFGMPANIDLMGDLLLVPELVSRVSLLDKDMTVVATLGDDRDRISADSKRTIRSDESKWQDGKFVHPHDACFDAGGNVYVAEWVAGGRVSKLAKKT